MPIPIVTSDHLFAGSVTCLQHQNGYRFSVDSILLAHFFAPQYQDHILDLGAGCGVISLIIAHRWPTVRLTCLEVQDSLFKLLQQNSSANFSSRMTCVAGDLRVISNLIPDVAFDWVVCNPPYYKTGAGRINSHEEQAIAKHELMASITDIAEAAYYALRNQGHAVFVYPVKRAADLLVTLREANLEPKRMQIVYPYPGADGIFVLLEAVKNGGKNLEIMPPLFIYKEAGGQFSEAMQALYEP